MDRIQKSFVVTGIFFLLPFFTYAQFTSTNYTIDAYAIGEQRAAVSTSSNYSVEYVPGSEFEYDVSTSSPGWMVGAGGGEESSPAPSPPPVWEDNNDVTEDNDANVGFGGEGSVTQGSRLKNENEPDRTIVPSEVDTSIETITPAHVPTPTTPLSFIDSVVQSVSDMGKKIEQIKIVEVIEEVPEYVKRPVVSVGFIALFTDALIKALHGARLTSLWARALGLVLPFFGIQRSRRWGVVYDAKTKRPLDPAIVTLRTDDGDEVSQAITDLDGRYGFLVPAGRYRMDAQNTNYVFPSKILEGKERDIMYDNLYFGSLFNLMKNEVVKYNIPLDPIGFDWNEEYKEKHNLYRFHSRRTLYRKLFSYFLYVVGVCITAVTAIITPTVLNVILLLLYVVVFPIIYIGISYRHPVTRVLGADGLPLPYALVTVYNKDRTVTIRKQIVDEYGQFYVLLPKGEYSITVSVPRDDGSYEELFSANRLITSGVIRRNLSFSQ